MPTDISISINAKKPRTGSGWFKSVANEQVVIEIAEQLTAVNSMEEGRKPQLRSKVLTEEPIMMHTIKQEKTRPNGQFPEDLFESKTGVQRKTKTYMMDSNMDCTKPRRRMVLSLKIARNPSKNERPSPNSRLP